MKLTCLQENLARGLSLVSRAVSTRSTMPVLGNVLLATDNGRLKLSATNLEIVITCWIKATVQEEGAITVPARTLVDLVNQLPQQQVDLEMTERSQTLHIACGRTEANVRGIDAQEFPLVPEPNLEHAIRLDADEFRRMINQVVFAAATDDTRPTLTGVSVRVTGKELQLAATDAFRLSVRSADLPNHVETPLVAIVPARALAEVARVISGENEMLYMTVPAGRNQIIFKLDSVVIVSQLIEGNFPDFTPIIPKRYSTRTVVNTAALLKACRTAAIFARESNHTARLRLEPGDELTPPYASISATSQEMGDNVAQVDAQVDGPAMEVAFNVKYLGDVLGVIETPQVVLETTSATEPGVIRPVDDPGFVHIVMPMHFGR
jgi:DNA polymerase-3 subunit beta